MAIKKSELYSSLWQSCDELRGGMDASQYKDYVLTLLFMKYVSDKAGRQADVGIVVPPGGGFGDMVRRKGAPDIGARINAIIGKLAEENDLRGVIDQADFNDESKLGSGREMQDRLTRLVAIFEGLDFGANRAEGDDLLGDAYEYLMRHFATESGKSKGQFYTPAEVSQVMAKVIGVGASTPPGKTIYDPACGSGSLLLKVAAEAPRGAHGGRGIAIYGQEMDNATFALARMNMFLHDCGGAVLRRGNTLAAPAFLEAGGGLRTFDFAVANPHFSTKAWSSGIDPANDRFGRFAHGIPPERNGDYAFLLHLIASLGSAGRGAIILPHGVLFRGKREAEIRRSIVRHGLIQGIIGLPANLFFGTGIPACILVIDKRDAASRRGIFMIDASRGFIKDGSKNRLRAQDIHRIVDVFNSGAEVPRYARMVPLGEIGSAGNDYNLNIPRYIDAGAAEDAHDLGAHLGGGIPDRDIDALDAYWQVLPSLRAALFAPAHRTGCSRLRVAPGELRRTVLEHAEFMRCRSSVGAAVRCWWQAHEQALNGLDQGASPTHPKRVIVALAEDLLSRFASVPLLSRYDVYQQLMDYWDETMHDDAYLIADAGWRAAARPRQLVDEAGRTVREMPDMTVRRVRYKMDLIPPALIAARDFAAEQRALDRLRAEHGAAAEELRQAARALADRGAIGEAALGKTLAAALRSRLAALGDADDADERDALAACLALVRREARSARAAREAQAALDAAVLERYDALDVEDIQALVVRRKWLAGVEAGVQAELLRAVQRLIERIHALEARYAAPLRTLIREVHLFEGKVEGHLRRMGFAW